MKPSTIQRVSKQLSVSGAFIATTAGGFYRAAPDGGHVQHLLGIGIAVGTSLTIVAGAVHAYLWLQARRHTGVPTTEQAKAVDLQGIHRMATRYFGDKVSSLERMRAWHRKCPKSFSVVYLTQKKGSERTQRMTGYFVILPLVASVVDAIRSGLKSITDLSEDDICGPSQIPAAIYIGAVVAEDPLARGAAVQALLTSIRSMAKAKLSISIITKPVTKDGLRLVKACGLTPIRGEEEDPLGKMHSGKLADVLNALRSARTA